MANRSREASEFGGVPGRVAPPKFGHPFGVEEGVAHEFARLMRATEPTDPADTPEAALAREQLRDGIK